MSHKNTNVKIGKFQKIIQHSMMVMISGEETPKPHMLFNCKLIGVTTFEISHHIEMLKSKLKHSPEIRKSTEHGHNLSGEETH